MAEGVAQVKQSTVALLGFIGGHHLGLVTATAQYRFRHRDRVAGGQRRLIVQQPLEKRRIADQAILDYLGHAGGEFPLRQGVEHGGIDHHGAGLMEGADHVLAARVVDGGLAAHRGIHLGQQGGGDLDKVHAALVAGGGETHHVTDHTAAQRHQRGGARVPLGHQGVENTFQRGQGFVLLAVRQDQGVALQVAQTRGNRLQVKRGDGLVADHHHLIAAHMAADQILAQQAAVDIDGVAAFGQRHVKLLHTAS